MKCNLKQPDNDRKMCGEELRAKSADAVKNLWKQHKREHQSKRRAHIDKLKQSYGKRVGELVAEYESIDKIPKHKLNGLHTKGIPNVPDGQNVNGLVYDKDGKRVPYDVLKQYVQGWD